jgi:hypothetical protein
MKQLILVVMLGSLLSCSGTGSPETFDESTQNLTGDLSQKGFLTIKSDGKGLTGDEFEREQTTLAPGNAGKNSYYRIASDGSHPPPFASVPTLDAFRNLYGFGSGATEAQAFYYNRGDLGLGREMHCVDTMSANGQVACYVTNFVSGDGEFAFGFSSNIAFNNLNQHQAVATVAMIFQKNGSAENDILFLVYSGDGTQLLDNAPLDRHGLVFETAFLLTAAFGGYHAGIILPEIFGTPGLNFNNHIPTNCLNCHGGTYRPQLANGQIQHVTDAFFLPWDLDQFEFEDAPGRTRAEQEGQFRALNQMARKVAFNQFTPAHSARMGLTSPIVQQIDAWYNNTSHSETLSGTFQSTASTSTQNGIIPAWNVATPFSDGTVASAAENRSLFYNVVRKCRGCHAASSTVQFNTPQSFIDLAPAIAADLKNHRMPHALQAQREFWLSGQPLEIETYFRKHGQVAAADVLNSAGPENIILLDPPVISALL